MEAWIKVIVKSLKWRCKSKHMNSSCQEWFLSRPSPKRSYPFRIHTPQLTPGQVSKSNQNRTKTNQNS
ncbi:hypothetical protein JZ751_000157 [Albula glossodonta]|uniref:Uncharacterized protein n=1 Tax=Albula glossodonta TaxID=121402 RepID=A0A8T2PVC5_9TELE|nr:hypothetical protein JZ751_000157 [Albula glossodonta]